ncbi:hypothetical protein QQS21_008021 [Conoideocrella luteorostrata]|uniref:Uncharacterized protein n=1 Tax=Conoideocrella luteorostrata TaxID=1105319 RepID=A0AAJ0CKF4_9HYPO|nr:hypothetical protein QQS21_008021 [Conoideocrella luteorostrata]
MRFAPVSAFVLLAWSAAAAETDAARDIGGIFPDQRCFTKIKPIPVHARECFATKPNEGVKITAKGVRCYAFQTEKCRLAGKSVDSSEKCHSVKSWGTPKSVRCFVGPHTEGEEAE